MAYNMAPFASRKAAKCTAKGIILERKKCPLRKALNANHLQGDNTVSIDTLSPGHEGDARRTSTCNALLFPQATTASRRRPDG